MTEHVSATSIAHAVATGQRHATEVVAEALTRIDQANADLNAFLEFFPERAQQRAAAIDADVQAGRPVGPLAGVPIAVKDNLCTTFGRTTCGSRMLENYRSPYDATVIQRIEAAGGVIVGKTNCDEFAMGSSNENSAFGPVRNPCDPTRVSGGSSGGSAATVAAGLVPVALGSDTGGSVRQPASFCGVAGLKPTYGRVSRYGLVAYGSSLDQVGPLAACVTDAALLLGVLGGHDPNDSTSVDRPVDDYVAALAPESLDAFAGKLRVGIPREYFGEGLDPEVRAKVEAAIEVLRGQGATIVDVSLPHSDYSIAAYYVIVTAECSSNLARFDGVHYGHRAQTTGNLRELTAASREESFGPEVKRRIMLGTFALASGYYDAYYLQALKVRRLIQNDFNAAFEKCDVLLGPTTPTPAFKLGEKLSDPLQMYLADVYTVPANLAGLPAISIPCGTSTKGLPIGMQLTAPIFAETPLLQAARLYERTMA